MGEKQPGKPEDRHPSTREGLVTTASPSREGVVTNGEPQEDDDAKPEKIVLKRGDMLL